MMARELFSVTDGNQDNLRVEVSLSSPESEVYLQVNAEEPGVFLTASEVKKLRKALKHWLIDNGHKTVEVG